jgi:hypothetical protein
MARPAWLVWGTGLAAGASAYPLGYFLVFRKAGGVHSGLEKFRELLHGADPLRSDQDAQGRAMFVKDTFVSVFDGSWNSGVIFNADSITVPGAAWKIAILVALQVILWGISEVRGKATSLQRLFIALPVSFAAFAFVFANRLGGHHYSILVPILYAGLAMSVYSLFRGERSTFALAVVVPFAALGSLNAVAQVRFQEKLVTTGGKGFLSDAILRFAADINATDPKPLLWFPDAVLALPLIMLTHGDVEMSDQLDDPEPRRRLCDGRDVWMVRIPRHASTERGERWLADLGWDAPPVTQVYAERTGPPVFEVLRFAGRRGACTTPPR